MELVTKGTRSSKIVSLYPHLYSKVMQLMRYRPPREGRTDLIYYFGPVGVGKTTAVTQTLASLRTLYPEFDYYSKMAGMSKYFDGYDNQLVTWIDDPVSPNMYKMQEEAQIFKQVVSTGNALVEVKYGSMVFDSGLLVITSNMTPEEMAEAFGMESRDALLRRFLDTCGAHSINSREDSQNKLRPHLIKCIKRRFPHLDINVADVLSNIPPVVPITYDDIKF